MHPAPTPAHPARHLTRLTFVLACLAFAGTAIAQSSGGDFALTRDVIAAGGGQAAGGDFAIVGTTAQAVPGIAQGGDSTLRGGFHLPAADTPPQGSDIFSNGFEASP